MTCILVVDGKGLAIRCLLCESVSHHPADIEHRYCGRCHLWHDAVAMGLTLVAEGGTHDCGEWRTARNVCALCGRDDLTDKRRNSDVLHHERTLNRLAKWRTVFASKWLGTRVKDDAECQSVKDLVERSLLMRVDINALVILLVDRQVFTRAEFDAAIGIEAEYLMRALERHFPGFTATDDGIHVEVEIAQTTMKGWPP